MASEIIVQTIKAPTSGANANKVIIPSGVTLDATAGDLVASGMTLQTVSNDFFNNNAGTSTSFFDTDVNISITTQKANSIIIYNGMMGFNASSSKYMHARLLRRVGGSDTEIWAPGRISPAGQTGSVGDIESWHSFIYVDYPNQPAGTTVEYRIQIRNSGVYPGGSVRIGDNSNSFVYLQEIAQ